MAKRWKIVGYHGTEPVFEQWLPGNIGHRQMQEVLARLQARHLSEREVIAATLGKSDHLRVAPITAARDYALMTNGSPDHYTAQHEDA